MQESRVNQIDASPLEVYVAGQLMYLYFLIGAA
jgi:hypothetical protein